MKQVYGLVYGIALARELSLHSYSLFQAICYAGQLWELLFFCHPPVDVPGSQGSSTCFPRTPLWRPTKAYFAHQVLGSHSMWSGAFSADVAGVSLEAALVVSHSST